MNVVQIPTLGKEGRFGNWLHLYVYAKRIAEMSGAILETPECAGRQIFAINDPVIGSVRGKQFRFEPKLVYDPNYTIDDFRRLLPLKPALEEFPKVDCAVHIRRCDFMTSRFWPQVDIAVIKRGVEAHGFDFSKAVTITEEAPHQLGAMNGFLADFVIMAKAKNLFVYPSSSFSGCAGMLNVNSVFTPHNFVDGPTDCQWRLR